MSLFEKALTESPDDAVRSLLSEHKLDATRLERMDGWSNRVWRTEQHIVRISSGRFRASFTHEQCVLKLIPASVPHPRVVASGQAGEGEWMIEERISGTNLLMTWKSLNEDQHRQIVNDIAQALHTIHTIDVPTDFNNPWLADALSPGGFIGNAYHAPPSYYQKVVASVRKIFPHQTLLDQVEQFIARRMYCFEDCEPCLIHSDAHFGNMLCDQGRFKAVLDFETSSLTYPDMELDSILRLCRNPIQFAGRNTSVALTQRDFEQVPQWFMQGYPSLFEVPHLKQRLEVYEAMWHLLQIYHFDSEHPLYPLPYLETLLRSDNKWADLV